MYDVFISHASEDKESVVLPLTIALNVHGLTTWLDVDALYAHDPLDQTIEDGINKSQFVIIVLSSTFFKKKWTVQEMDIALELEKNSNRVVLPLYHNLQKNEIGELPPDFLNRPVISTSEGLETAFARLIESIKIIKGESSKAQIFFASDRWPMRHTIDSWLDDKPIKYPLISWPADLLKYISHAEKSVKNLNLATSIPGERDWFLYQGKKLRDMDIQGCRTAPKETRKLMERCPVRLTCLAEGLKDRDGSYWHATYSARVFLFLAVNMIYRAISPCAYIAGFQDSSASRLEDIIGVSKAEPGHGNQRFGTVKVTSEALSAIWGGRELILTAPVDQLRYLAANTNAAEGHLWMDFFEHYLIPQIEADLLLSQRETIVRYSIDSNLWHFSGFKDETGKHI